MRRWHGGDLRGERLEQARSIAAVVGIRGDDRRGAVLGRAVQGCEAAQRARRLAAGHEFTLAFDAAPGKLHQLFGEHRIGQPPGMLERGQQRGCGADVIGRARALQPGVEEAGPGTVRGPDNPFELVDGGGYQVGRLDDRGRAKAGVDRCKTIAQSVCRGPRAAQRRGQRLHGGGDPVVVGDRAGLDEEREESRLFGHARRRGRRVERLRERHPERVACRVVADREVLPEEKQDNGGRGGLAGRGIDRPRRNRVELRRRKLLQAANYNEAMIAVRFATLVALVVWLGAMTAARFGELFRRLDLVAYACGAVTIVGLFVMKFIGPPPHGFVARAGLTVLMLAIAVGAALTRGGDTAAALLTVNIAIGFVLLFWYVRE